MLGGVWAVIGGGALVFSACYGRNCEGTQQPYGLDAGQGQLITADIWQSSPVEGEWLPFPRQGSYVMTLPFGGRRPYLAIADVSASRVPDTDQSTTGSGNLVEKRTAPNQVTVINDTCSDYYVRVVAFAAPVGALDAGSFPPTNDAGIADAAIP